MPSLNGEQLISAHIAEPSEGTWTAVCSVQTAELPSGAVEIEIEGVTWKGTVRRAVFDFETASVFVVGGAGGLNAPGIVRDYVQTSVRTVVSSIMQQSGETLSPSSDQTILSGGLVHFHTAATPLGIQLQSALGAAAWRIGRDGLVLVTAPNIFTPFSGDASVILEQRADAANRSEEYSVGQPLLEPGQRFSGRDMTYVETVLTPDKLMQETFT